MSSCQYRCTMCSFVDGDYQRYYKHLHNHDGDIPYNAVCRIDSCQKTYKHIRSLKRHINNVHPTYRKVIGVKEVIYQETIVDSNVILNDIENEDPLDVSLSADEDTEAGNCVAIDFEEYISHFLLELREMKKVSGEACSFVSSTIGKIVQLVWKARSVEINKMLKQLGITNKELEDLLSEEELHVTGICDKFAYMKNLEKYIIDHSNGNLVEPEDVMLGYNESRKKYDTCQYVPLISTLDVLLRKNDVLKCVFEEKETSSDIKSFSDGVIFKESELYSEIPEALQIVVYNDEFVPVNPLGNKQTQYKIDAFYFVLGNLERKHRTKLKMINLLVLCTAKLVTKYGYEKILTPLLRDIRLLEIDGMKVQLLNGLKSNVYGTLSMLIGDNLGAHSLGGYFESFGPQINKVCRYCNGDREQISKCFKCSDFEKRTIESYDYQVETIELDPSYRSLYGIKTRSPFNDLNFFHVVGRQPFDIYHDIFEGFGKEVLAETLKSLITSNYFTIDDINERIDNIEYAGFEKGDKPQHIKKPKKWDDFSIKMKAVETSNFVRLIPILVGKWVPELDPVWEILLQFVKLVQLLLSPIFSRGECQYLADETEAFLISFMDHFRGSVKPKAHFLVHYPSQIVEVGPPVDHGTIRFEAKHAHFKETYNRSKNRINIVKTLARRHQFYMYLFHKEPLLLTPDPPVATNTKVIDPSMIADSRIRDALVSYVKDTMMTINTTVKLEGIIYDQGDAVVVSFVDDTFQFACIQHCFFIGKVLHLLCQNLHTSRLNFHYNSYEVNFGEDYRVYKINDLLDSNPLGIYNVGNLWLIPLKHYLRME